ncbi:hypothetical protein D6D22_09139 [Aureobasidium pullulans]|uniref:Uncharacterized protein n=1 Tax=Aureobasidium pullulans TaxID=5580 RepID=A0A4S8X2Q4_AURPU|nr:hypothetical protein D6D22_09139 [Aureobasidium pullulans]
MTRTDKQVHYEMTEASFDQTIQFSELDSMLALTMKDPTSSPSPVGYRGNGQHQQFGRAHHQQQTAHLAMPVATSQHGGARHRQQCLSCCGGGGYYQQGRILGPYDSDNGYYNEEEGDFYHGDRNSDYYRRQSLWGSTQSLR